MKHFFIYPLSLLMLGFILWGCSDQQSPTAISEESNTTLNKATIIKGSFDYVYSELDTYTDCVTGASMRNYGTVKANYKKSIRSLESL